VQDVREPLRWYFLARFPRPRRKGGRRLRISARFLNQFIKATTSSVSYSARPLARFACLWLHSWRQSRPACRQEAKESAERCGRCGRCGRFSGIHGPKTIIASDPADKLREQDEEPVWMQSCSKTESPITDRVHYPLIHPSLQSEFTLPSFPN
jgi:hypothetical protein